MTDKEKVAKLFRASLGRTVNLLEIVQGMGIVEYSGRISDCRSEWGCTCGKDTTTCTASEHIINVKKGWYKYVTSLTPENNRVIPLVDINVKREELETELSLMRGRWKACKGTKQADSIEHEAKLIKYRIQMLEKAAQSGFEKQVQEALI